MAGCSNLERVHKSENIFSLRLRGARGSDYKAIYDLHTEAGFDLDTSHLERLFVVEDQIGIIAVGSFVHLLEGAFVTDPRRSRKCRALALTTLVHQAETECRNIGFDKYYILASNDIIASILKNKFGFIRSKAKQLLLRWIGEENHSG